MKFKSVVQLSGEEQQFFSSVGIVGLSMWDKDRILNAIIQLEEEARLEEAKRQVISLDRNDPWSGISAKMKAEAEQDRQSIVERAIKILNQALFIVTSGNDALLEASKLITKDQEGLKNEEAK